MKCNYMQSIHIIILLCNHFKLCVELIYYEILTTFRNLDDLRAALLVHNNRTIHFKITAGQNNNKKIDKTG